MRDWERGGVRGIKLFRNKMKQFYKCKYCKQEIPTNTDGKLLFCECGKLGVDGNGYYVRVIGEKDNSELVDK